MTYFLYNKCDARHPSENPRAHNDQDREHSQAATNPKNRLATITMREGEDPELRAAEAMSGPFISNAFAFNKFTRGTVGDVSLDKLVAAMAASAERVKSGDMRDVEAILVSQATVLNGLFADLVRRSSVNLGGNYFDAEDGNLNVAFELRTKDGCPLSG